MNNSIFVIRPFKVGSIWAFTDGDLGIHQEPFCGQVNDIIDAMLLRADLPASEPFTALFSSSWFPGVHLTLAWHREEGGGNWYHDVSEPPREWTETRSGWLCPVLCKFFTDGAPCGIFVRAEK